MNLTRHRPWEMSAWNKNGNLARVFIQDDGVLDTGTFFLFLRFRLAFRQQRTSLSADRFDYSIGRIRYFCVKSHVKQSQEHLFCVNKYTNHTLYILKRRIYRKHFQSRSVYIRWFAVRMALVNFLAVFCYFSATCDTQVPAVGAQRVTTNVQKIEQNVTLNTDGRKTVRQTASYPTRYDYIDVEAVMSNERILKILFNCVMNRGPCTREGLELKSKLVNFAI